MPASPKYLSQAAFPEPNSRSPAAGARGMALLKGTLDVLVLKALSWGPMHGFEITSWLEERSGGRIGVTDAALLQALHRMEERELVTAEWGVTRNGRRARYYRLTAKGLATLRADSAAIVDDVAALTAVLAARRPEPGGEIP